MGVFNLPSLWLSRTGYAESVSHPGPGLTGPALIAAVPGDLSRVRAPDIGAKPERIAQPGTSRLHRPDARPHPCRQDRYSPGATAMRVDERPGVFTDEHEESGFTPDVRTD